MGNDVKLFLPTTFYKQKLRSGLESEGQALVGGLKVGHALVSGYGSGGNHYNRARM